MCRKTNWTKECEDALNDQIHLEYQASHQYHLMFTYFDQDTVGLDKVAAFFEKNSVEERTHADALMKYQNLRGGRVNLEFRQVSLDYLKHSENNDVLASFEKALDMEQAVYDSLYNLHAVAERNKDPQFADSIEVMLDEQLKAINSIAKQMAQLMRIGNDGHGVWQFAQAVL